MAQKDLIIGGADGYNYDQLKYWINSIDKCGFEGEVALVCTNISMETVDQLTARGVKVILYGKFDVVSNSYTFDQHMFAPHVARFFYMWNFLQENQDAYNWVIATDTRDVIFQKNPVEWLYRKTFLEDDYGREVINYKLVGASEGLFYKDEPWGNQNLLDTFGPIVHEVYKNKLICNVGTIAGRASYMKDLMNMIFQMSINRRIPIVDQAVFNFIINQEPYQSIFFETWNHDAWAIQLGTSSKAIEAGSGDIGKLVCANPDQMITYLKTYLDKQPVFENGRVLNHNGEEFVIVHQYDRLDPVTRDAIMKQYED